MDPLFLNQEQTAEALGVSVPQFLKYVEKEPDIYGPDSSKGVSLKKGARYPMWSRRLVEFLAEYRTMDEYGDQVVTRDIAKKARKGLSRVVRQRFTELTTLV